VSTETGAGGPSRPDDACARWAGLVDRDAIGETLSTEQRRFLREHAASCPACGAEATVWQGLTGLADGPTEPPRADVIDRLLSRARADRPAGETPPLVVNAPRFSDRPPRPSARPPSGSGHALPPLPSLGRRMVPAGIAVLAAAAVVALWPRAQPPGKEKSVASTQAVARVHLAAGGALVDGKPAQLDAELNTHARLEAMAGTLCLQIDPGVTACLARGGRGEIADLTLASRRLRLQEGKIVVSLGTQPQHTSFVVETEWGTVTAVGTEFAVAIDASPMNPQTDQLATVRVGHGSVVVRAPRLPEVAVTAGESLWLGDTRVQRDIATAERVEDRTVIAPALLDARSGGTLEVRTQGAEAKVTINGKLIGPSPVALHLPAGATTIEIAPSEGGAVVTERVEIAAGAAIAKEYSVGAAVPTGDADPDASAPAPPTSAAAEEPASPAAQSAAGEMLERARQLRAQGQYRAAAEAYRKLQTEHPKSAEARAGLVSLGDLSLSKLGDPAGALRAFDAYLDSGGGVLAEEARIGRIRSLRTLGRKGDERTAIETFLQSHPRSVHVQGLEKRLQALSAK
jgi:hypothetical protein